MGNDGGSIPGRQDLVKSKRRRRHSETEEIVKQSKSKYCSLSKETLKKPIVGDKLGQIYNKTAIIQALIEKNLPDTFNHISSLKDVKDINGEINKNGYLQCPITRSEFSGINKFYFLWNCGCIMSKKAIDEIGMKDKCLICGKDFDNEKDLISLNYTKEEKENIKTELLSLKERKKQIINKNRNNNNTQAAQAVISRKRGREKTGKDDITSSPIIKQPKK